MHEKLAVKTGKHFKLHGADSPYTFLPKGGAARVQKQTFKAECVFLLVTTCTQTELKKGFLLFIRFEMILGPSYLAST